MVTTGVTAGQELRDRAARVIPGGVNSGQRAVPGLEDLVIASTHGSGFTDANGRTFTDYHSAFGPPLLGHNDPDVNAAVREMIDRLDPMGVGVTEAEIELAERVCANFSSIERVVFTCTGTEATYNAIRLSRAFTGRKRIVKFQGCYHGWHDAVALNVISKRDRLGGKDPLSAGIMTEVQDATIVLPFNDLEAVEAAFAKQGEEIAALIVEPIPHNIGAVLPAPGFLEGLREICSRFGALLIFDEVITGFRHGLGGYQAICGVRPDLTTLGKAIANGYPIAALGGRADAMEMFNTIPGQPVFLGGTFFGHPAMVAAALATIRKLETEPVHDHVFRLGELARDGLRSLFDRLGIPAQVSGFGSVFLTYFMDGPVRNYTDLLANDAELFVGYRLEQMKDGIFELPSNLKRSHFSYAHTASDVDRLLSATERSVKTVLARR